MAHFSSNSALFFDVDGVILDSVPTKGETFALLFDEAHRAVIYHIHERNGGMNRRDKIALMVAEVEQRIATETELDRLVAQFEDAVFQRVMDAPEILGARQSLESLAHGLPLHAISASPESEVVRLLENRDLSQFFTSIHGHPNGKAEVLRRLLSEHGYSAADCLAFGDSVQDARAAESVGVPFVLIDSLGVASMDGLFARLPNLEGLDLLVKIWLAREYT